VSDLCRAAQQQGQRSSKRKRGYTACSSGPQQLHNVVLAQHVSDLCRAVQQQEEEGFNAVFRRLRRALQSSAAAYQATQVSKLAVLHVCLAAMSGKCKGS
jgi:hypothetical protein